MEGFYFIRPYWLAAIMPLCALLLYTRRRLSIATSWQREVDAELLPYLLVGTPQPLARNAMALICSAWLLCVIALAGPAWEQLPSPLYRSIEGRVLILDLSRSMDAGDISPSRLVRAKQKLQDILSRAAEHQTALIVFSHAPYVLVPMTDDVQTIQLILPSLQTDIMPAQGSTLSAALAIGLEVLQQSDTRQGSLWLFTDSEPDVESDAIARQINAAGFRLHVLAFGTASGASIPTPAGVLLDDGGNEVIAPLIEAPLKKLAMLADGKYLISTPTDEDVLQLLSTERNSGSGKDGIASDLHTDQWLDRGPWCSNRHCIGNQCSYTGL